ncbi:MAG: MarR family transcriptional regulator [Clostridium sp.]|nr:MarR family transcriptional regulator [Clostridium sp.]
MSRLAEEHEYIGKSIAKIHKMSMMYLSKSFSKFNIGSGQCFFLVKVYNNPGITQEELASSMNLDKGTTARAIKILEDNGYIKRVKRDDDKRAYNVIATEKAESIKKDVYLILDSWEEALKGCFTIDEGEQFIRLLNKLKDSDLLKGDDIK